MANSRSLCVVLSCVVWLAALKQSASGQNPPLPTVLGFVVTHYASVTDPILCAFAPDGTLYTGRDATGSGGGSGDAVKIHRISPAGVSVTEYGPAIEDPDYVSQFDNAGLFLVRGRSTRVSREKLQAPKTLGLSQGVPRRPDGVFGIWILELGAFFQATPSVLLCKSCGWETLRHPI